MKMNNNTIFAVDDEPVILDLYKSILGVSKRERLDFFSNLEEESNEHTFDLRTFETGELYLDELEKFYKEGNKLPLCLLDMRLPGKHGLEIAKETRKIDSNIIIIIITAYSDYSVKEFITQFDHNIYYLHKPFRNDELFILILSNLKNWNSKFSNVDIKKELAIDSTEDGLWEWDIHNNIVHLSVKWKEMLGYKDSEIKDELEEWSSRVHPEDLNKVMQDINIHFEGKSDYYINEHRLKCKDGSYKWILDRGKALFDSNDKAYKMTGFHTDITQRKKLEEELVGVRESLSDELNIKISNEMKLKHTNKQLEEKLGVEIQLRHDKEEMLLQHTRQAAMGEMISMIAHQWRQPLTSIRLSTDTILLDIILDSMDTENLKENIELINKQVSYLSQTIDDFRNFFQPNKEKEVVPIEECIEDAISIIDQNLKNHNITLVRHFYTDIVAAVYRNELIQVLLNILKNSLDALTGNSIKKPVIIIEIGQSDTEIEIKISDNAGGIEKEKLLKIFEPYYTTKSAKNGTGLGLYMSKMIVEGHSKGSIIATNTNDGVEFKIVLPIMDTENECKY